MNQSNISLVIPSYNRAHLIGETIESALNQTLAFKEIIVVDDGSTDDTSTQLSKYEGAITYIRTHNQGVQAARNHGIACSDSTFVVLCDSDDLLMPRFVEKMHDWLVKHPETDVLYCNFVTFEKQSTSKDKFSQAPAGYFQGASREGDFIWNIPDLYGKSIEFQPMFSSGCVCRREFYQSVGGYDSKFKGVGAEDWEFCLRVIARGKIVLCNDPLIRIRRHPGNDSANTLHMRLGEVAILEHALQYHESSARYSKLIARSMEGRRLDAFNAAFSEGRFEWAEVISRSIKTVPLSIKFHAKKAIILCPQTLRNYIWKFVTRY